MGETEKPDEKILFPDSEVEGYTIRPWTLAQAVALAPTLGGVIDVIGKSGAGDSLAKILDAVDIESPGMESVMEAFQDSWKDVVKALPGLIPKFLPYAPAILSISLDASREEVDKFDLGKTSRLLREIATHNIEYLKNSFGPGAAVKVKAS